MPTSTHLYAAFLSIVLVTGTPDTFGITVYFGGPGVVTHSGYIDAIVMDALDYVTGIYEDWSNTRITPLLNDVLAEYEYAVDFEIPVNEDIYPRYLL